MMYRPIVQIYASRLSLIAALLAAGCKSNEFSGGSQSGKKDGGSNGGGGPTGGGKPPVDAPPSSPAPGDDVTFDSGKSCFKVQPTFHFMFVIDKTGSMDPSIRTVIKEAGSFAQKVASITLPGAKAPLKDSVFGAVSYIDVERENMYVDFTKDPGVFSSKLAEHNTGFRGHGSDSIEGGLMAAKVGLSRLASSIRDGQAAVPVLIVISDTFSHNGLGPERARLTDDSGVVAEATKTVFRRLLLIDAVPGVGLLPFATPASQWSSLRTKIGAANGLPGPTLGSNIGFSPATGFSSQQLLSVIPALIQDSVKVCE